MALKLKDFARTNIESDPIRRSDESEDEDTSSPVNEEPVLGLEDITIMLLNCFTKGVENIFLS